MRAFLPALLLAACSSNPKPQEPECVPDKKKLRDPATVHEFLVDAVRCKHYAYAHQALVTDISYESFYPPFATFEAFRGLFLKSSLHGAPREVEGGYRIRICNLEYGFSREFDLAPLKAGKITIYRLKLAARQIDELRQAALDWWNFQFRAAGDFYVYTKGARPPRKWSACPHGPHS